MGRRRNEQEHCCRTREQADSRKLHISGLLNTEIWKDILASSSNTGACAEYWNDNIPIARVIEPSEIGELAAFLLSERSLCITGANIFADGGMTSQLISREPRAESGG